MRDKGTILGGEALTKAPDLFIGAAANPFGDPFSFRVIRLAKKVAAGAEFIQTQCIYNLDRFEKWMAMCRDKGLTGKDVYPRRGDSPEVRRHGAIHEEEGGRHGCAR